MQTDIEKEPRTDYANMYSFIECHEGTLPYDTEVLSEEALVEGSQKSIFGRVLDWLGRNAFTWRETKVLREEFWLARPEFLLEAFDRCGASKWLVVDGSCGKYFYLLSTEAEQLRRELLANLKGMLRAAPAPAMA